MDRKTVLGIVLVLAGGAFLPPSELRAVESHGLKLTRPMIVEGIYLRAAVYDVHWELQGTHATVTFSRKGHAAATVQGKLSTFDRAVAHDTLYFSKYSDGYFYIKALGFANTNKGVLFPAVRPRPNTNTPPDNSLLEDDWRDHPAAVPRVYR